MRNFSRIIRQKIIINLNLRTLREFSFIYPQRSEVIAYGYRDFAKKPGIDLVLSVFMKRQRQRHQVHRKIIFLLQILIPI